MIALNKHILSFLNTAFIGKVDVVKITRDRSSFFVKSNSSIGYFQKKFSIIRQKVRDVIRYGENRQAWERKKELSCLLLGAKVYHVKAV